MFKNFVSWKSFFKILNRQKPYDSIVFYSQGNSYKAFLFPLIQEILLKYNFNIYYLSSDYQDTILSFKNDKFTSYYIGNGLALTLTFYLLKTRLMLMTMPDLNLFHLKKSIYPVHYIYIQHSLVSSHMVYREGAFDHYDTIFCAGKHHFNEIKEWETINRLKPKNLFKHGYLPLDTLLEQKKKASKIQNKTDNKLKILIAPSWGKNGIIHKGSENLIDTLLTKNYHVTIRFHPHSEVTSKKQIKQLRKKYKQTKDVKFDDDKSVYDSLFKTDILITDWSGIAIEFSFAVEKPVIFIDVEKKINNLRYHELTHVPIEIKIRNRIGSIIGFNNLSNIDNTIQDSIKNTKQIKKNIKSLRNKYVFNLNKSKENGSSAVYKLFKNLKKNNY